MFMKSERDPELTRSYNLVRAIRGILTRRGFKCHFKRSMFQGAPGYVLAVVDPADPDSVFFVRWLSFDDLEIVIKSFELFWRYL